MDIIKKSNDYIKMLLMFIKKIFLCLLLTIGLIQSSIAASNESDFMVYSNQQFNPFIKYIDVKNLRFFSLEEASNEFLKKVGRAYLLLLEENKKIDYEMRAQYLDISKDHFIYQRIGRQGPEYYENKFNTSFDRLPHSRTIENGPFRDNVTDYIWEYKKGDDSQINEVIEHLLHTITNVAFTIQFSDWDWQNPSSLISLASQEAIDKGIYNISDYREILNSGDREGFNKVITTEFAYWLIAAEWGLGDFLEIPNSEFRLNNYKEIAEKLPLGHRLYKCYVEKILSPPKLDDLLSIFPISGNIAEYSKQQDTDNDIYDCPEQNINSNNFSTNLNDDSNSNRLCRGEIKAFWDEYLELNTKEFNSEGYLFIVVGEDGRCEYGMGRSENDGFNDCTKWKDENNIIGQCELYAKGEQILWNENSE